MNEDRFTGKAEIYNKYRPSYPEEFIDYLYHELGFSKSSVIADIGSGTGIFSRLLLSRGSTVYCVEPNCEMRQIAEDALSCYEGFISINANANNTTLENSSVDFVTAAQSFHWFDKESFKTECKRILKSGKKTALIWNERDYESELVKKDYIIREKYAADDKKGLGPSRINHTGFFKDDKFDFKIFSNDLVLDREAYIGMNLSRSYSPKKDTDPEFYRGFVHDLGELFDIYSKGSILIFPHFMQSYIGEI